MTLTALLDEAETRLARKRAHRWCPWEPTDKQRQFLALEDLEALYGGAAGPGKSVALLMAALQYVDVPGYSALLLRRTHPQLHAAGGLIQLAHAWLRESAAEWSEMRTRYTFPSGAIVQFGSLQYSQDMYNYQGPAYQYVGWDELTQWREEPYRYLLSRIRRTEGMSDIPLRSRAASNPGGIGHDWVKRRFVEPPSPDRPFVAGLLDDNPHLDRQAYRRNLSLLDPTTRAQLEHGVWVRNNAGLVYPLGDHNLIGTMPYLDGPRYIVAVDLGASETTPTTAFSVLCWDPKVPRAVWVVRSWKEAGLVPSDIAERILGLRDEYSPVTSTVIDAGALGVGYLHEFQRRWHIACEPAEKRDKLGYRKLINGALSNGELLIVESDNGDLIEEMRNLPWNESGTDNAKGFDNHLTDSVLYGWRRALAFAGVAPEYRPAPGSREALELEASRIEAEEVRQAWHDAREPWWRKRH